MRLGHGTKALSWGVVAVLGLAAPAVADAAIFTVTETGDGPDASLADMPNACDVALATAGDQCTLRAAIEEANATAGADEVRFAIPGGGVHLIAPASGLPDISGPVVIDGLTQPGAEPNTVPAPKRIDAELRIEVSGKDIPVTPFTNAFDVQNTAGGTVIRGLVINRFSGAGIVTRAPTTIEGNFIGTNAAGDRARPIGFDGVFGSGGTTVIGGTSPEARNLISGNGRAAVTANPAMIVRGNLMGTAADGRTALGNEQGGLVLAGGGNKVGGPDAPNVIAFNGLDGISVLFNMTVASLFSANRIYANDQLAIDLGDDGKTPNDALDADGGPNGLQNFPVLSSARTDSGRCKIKGELAMAPSATFIVELFSNTSGAREAERFLGRKSVTTDSDGDASFTFKTEHPVGPGKHVAATATAADKSTSEFSKAVKVRRG